MHTISKFFTVLVILMVLIPSTIAAPNENANPKAGLKIVDKSKGTMKEIKDDKVKGIKSSSGDIIVDVKGKNSIKLKDSKPSKDAKEHKKAKVSIPVAELQKIDADKDGVFGILETSNNVVIGQYTATSAQLAAGIDLTFSEVEINGFSGYREETFTDVESGDVLNTDDISGNYVRTLSVDGTVPSYLALDENNLSTWPGSPAAIFPYNSNYNDIVSGIAGTPLDTKISIAGGDYLNVNNSSVSYLGSAAAFKPENFTIFSKVKVINPQAAQYETIYRKRYAGKGPIEASYGLTVNYNDNALRGYITTNATSYDYISTTPITPSVWQLYTHAHQTGADILLINDTSVKTHSPAASPIIYDDTGEFRVGKFSAYNKNLIDYIVIYHEYSNATVRHALLASGQGISADGGSGFVGYNVASGVEKIISNGGTAATVKYIDTSGGTRNVTIRTYYTEDTTISTQSSDNSFHNISIIHNAGNTITNGTIIMPIAPLYTGTAVLDSNNTNAVITQNRTHFTIYTGALTTANWFGYNVSVPNNADHGMWMDRLMQWVSGVGWNFVGNAPTDYTDDLSDQITVTVS